MLQLFLPRLPWKSATADSRCFWNGFQLSFFFWLLCPFQDVMPWPVLKRGFFKSDYATRKICFGGFQWLSQHKQNVFFCQGFLEHFEQEGRREWAKFDIINWLIPISEQAKNKLLSSAFFPANSGLFQPVSIHTLSDIDAVSHPDARYSSVSGRDAPGV